jgi:hypothetical protein
VGLDAADGTGRGAADRGGVIAQVDGQGGVVGVDGDDLTGVGAAGGIRWPATMITPLLATRRWIRTGAREGLG